MMVLEDKIFLFWIGPFFYPFLGDILPKFNMEPKMMVSNRNLLFQGQIFRFHVKLQGWYVFFFGEEEGWIIINP